MRAGSPGRAQFGLAVTPIGTALAIAVLSAGPISGAGLPPTPRASPHLTEITPYLDQVSPENLWGTIDTLSSIWTRRCGTPGNGVAAEYLRRCALNAGYAGAAFDSFWCDATQQYERNVVFSKPGTTAPTEHVVVGAHYDSRAGLAPDLRSPGADDNASGVAALLEIAEIVRDLPLERTTVFALFTAEEIGPYGSAHFVEDALEQGLDLRLYVDIDCAAYTNGSWRAEAYTCNWNLSLARAIGQVLRCYTGILPASGAARQDAAPFHAAGVPTAMLWEVPLNPRVNSPFDSLRYLTPDYAADMTRANLATVLGIARLEGYDWPPPETRIAGTCPAEGLGLPPGGSALFRWRSEDFDGGVVGYEYRLTEPGGSDTSFTCVPASVESLEACLEESGAYRFTVRAVDGDGLRDPEPPEVVIPVSIAYACPPLKVSADGGGQAEYRGSLCTSDDFPDTLFAGERVTFSWKADASMYCSSIAGYRSAWDDSLDLTSLPDPADTTFTVVLEPGEHVLRLCAVDDLGYATTGELRLTAVPLLPEADVLLVDDCNVTLAPDALENAFYDTLLSGRDWQEWDPSEHVSGGEQEPPPVSMLAGARCVVWSVDNTGPALASFEEGGYGPLEGYVRAGGNLVLAGFCPTQALSRAPSYPVAFADGDFLHDHGGLVEARNTGGRTIQSPPDRFGYAFLGACACEGTGLADVWIDSLGKWSGQYWRGGVPYCDAYTPADDAEVLYLFDAYVNTAFEGAPCGVRRLGTEGAGSVLTLGFPLYFLKTAGATSMMASLLDGLLAWQEPSELLSVTWSAGSDSVVLSWSVDPEAGVQGFEVLRRDAGSMAYTSLTPTPIPATPSGQATFTDGGVEPGRSYEYALSVIERWGGRTHHGPWPITTPAAAPSALSLSVAQNPAGGSVTLRLAVPEPGGRALVRVYNAAGKLVATVHDGEMSPGEREIVWNCIGDDGLSVATGVYFGEASAGGSTVRTKLVVLR